jgi:hypothetical protein
MSNTKLSINKSLTERNYQLINFSMNDESTS